MKKIYLFLLIIFGYTVYGQQKGISYQAVIINPNAIAAPGFNGTSIPIANKTICMSFQIINSNNQVEYQESQSITTDMYGMVNVVIGSGNTGTGLVTSLDAVNWSQGANKLVVSVNTEGVCSNYTEISNQLLNYTPYSLYAQNADIKDGYVTDVKVAMGINPNKVGLGNVNNTSDTNKPVSIATQLALDLKASATDVTTSLALKENLSNKSSDIVTDATSTTKYPSVKAVKDYVDANSNTSSGTIVDADTITKGKIQLAGDLAGTADLPTVPGLVLKANTTDVITALNLKANAATVSTELALKLDTSQKGVPNGLATLNSAGIIPSSQLPPVTISSTNVVGSDAEMTSLTNATVGSIAIRTDLNKNYVLSATDPSIISNWIELLTPAAPVQTVNGYVGSVNLSKTDIDLSNVDNTSDRNKPISDPTQIALNLKSNTADLDAAMALKINRTDVDAALNLKLDANKVGLSNGVASLNALGKIPTEQIPAISFSSVKVLSNQADMLALSTAVIGSVVIRTDVNKNYVLAQADPSNLANWIELLTPAPPVQSVNGYTGSVSLSKSDFDLANVNNTSDNNKPISTATQTALDLKANESSLAAVATTGDYRDLLNLPSAVDASSLSGTLAIAKGGTGSNTKNFVDLLTDQTISGAKTFTTNGTYSAALTVSGNLVAPNIGSSSVVDFTHRIVTAATTNTFTKLIQFGTGGLSGSNTTINIGSGISGANNAITIGGESSALTTTTTINGNVILPSLSAEGIVTNDANGVLNTTATLAVANGGTGTSTLTGLIRGNGIGAMTAAVAGTDYLLPTGSAASLTNFPILNQNTTGNATTATLATTANSVSGLVTGANGGTGVINTGKTITLGGNFETGHAINFTTTGSTTLSLPVSGTLSTVQQVDAKAPLASPALTGTPTAPTAAVADNSTKIATTEFVQAAVSAGNAGLRTIGSILATSNAKGAMINGVSELVLTPADASNGGVVTTGTQTFAGSKTFANNLVSNGTLTAGTVTYPNTHGINGNVLSTTGNGTLAWTSLSALGAVQSTSTIGSDVSLSTSKGVLQNVGSSTFTNASQPQYLTVPGNSGFDFGTGNFTIEGWIYVNDYSGWNGGLGDIVGMNDGASNYLICGITQNGGFRQIWNNGLSGSGNAASANTLVPLQTWTHFALVRNGDNLTTYLNGVSRITRPGIGAVSMGFSNRTLGIGADPVDGNNRGRYNLTNIRIVKGTAVYNYGNTIGTSYFSPPTTIGNIAGTQLLIAPTTTTLTDLSPNAFTITKVGTPTINIPPTTNNLTLEIVATSSLTFTKDGNLTIPSLSTAGIVTNNANGVLSTTSTIAVANGGTGTTTLTGLVKGNGNGVMTAAVAGTDYLLPNGSAASLTNFPILNQNTTGTAVNVSGVILGANGGTGVANIGKTMTLGGNFSTDHSLAFSTSGATTLSLPTSGTLATVQQLDAKELIANKSTDVTLGASNSPTSIGDTKFPTQNAVKAYVASALSTGASSIVGYTSMLQTNGNNPGTNNVGIGPSTAPGTDGGGNTSIGSIAMQSNTTSWYNTAVGFRAMSNISTSGSNDNVAIGNAAAYYRGSGWDVNNQQLRESIYIGSMSRASANNQRNEIVIGYNAIGSGTNTIQLGNGSITDVKTSGKLTTGAVTYPNAHGTSGQVLSTTGSGNLAWSSVVDATSNQTIAGLKTFSNKVTLNSGTAGGASLEVNGASTNTVAFNAASGTSIDFTKSNLAYTSANAGAFTLTGMKDGGTYTLAVQGATSGTSTFTQAGLTFTSINNAATTASKHTLYTFIVMGTTVYYSMMTGL